MCIFKVNKWIKLRFWLKNNLFKSPDLNPLDYHVRFYTGMLYMPKPTNAAEQKTALLQ